jgi:hypothetical protein
MDGWVDGWMGGWGRRRAMGDGRWMQMGVQSLVGAVVSEEGCEATGCFGAAGKPQCWPLGTQTTQARSGVGAGAAPSLARRLGERLPEIRNRHAARPPLPAARRATCNGCTIRLSRTHARLRHTPNGRRGRPHWPSPASSAATPGLGTPTRACAEEKPLNVWPAPCSTQARLETSPRLLPIQPRAR